MFHFKQASRQATTAGGSSDLTQSSVSMLVYEKDNRDTVSKALQATFYSISEILWLI